MRDLRELHDPHLHLPIDGKVYTVHSPNADLGLEIKRFIVDPESDPADEIKYIAKLLGAEYDPETDTMSGGLWDEMNSDGVPYNEIIHVGNTALAHYGVGESYGEMWWETRLGKETEPLVPEAVAQWAKEQEQEKQPPKSRKKKTSS